MYIPNAKLHDLNEHILGFILTFPFKGVYDISVSSISLFNYYYKDGYVHTVQVVRDFIN